MGASQLVARLHEPGRTVEITGWADGEATRIDALISKIRQAIGHLNEFRTALISAAVTGKIDVRESTPR